MILDHAIGSGGARDGIEVRRELREGDNVSALHARSAGADTRLVGLAWVDAYQAVLALPDAGIREPAELAGRRLGLRRLDAHLAIDVHRAAASRGFHSATALACLFCDEYEQVDVAPARDVADDPYAAEAAALLRGDVDAIYVAGTAGRAVARRLGATAVVDLGSHLDPMVRVNATTPVALTTDARLLTDEPEGVARALADRLRASGESGGRAPAVGLGRQALDALGAQNDWLLAQGFLAGAVDLAAWVDHGPLEAASALV